MSPIKPLVKAKKFTTAALHPFQVICADHIGPLPKDEEGYQYILVEICAFLRWIELFPTKTAAAEESARCIHQHFGRWGTADLLTNLLRLIRQKKMASLNEPTGRS